mgnify:CR=1 FL=1
MFGGLQGWSADESSAAPDDLHESDAPLELKRAGVFYFSSVPTGILEVCGSCRAAMLTPAASAPPAPWGCVLPGVRSCF